MRTERQGGASKAPAAGARALASLARADGFSLVEILVAIMVLAVGILGVATMAIQASATTTDTKAREGATNLAREVVETIVSLPYASLDPSAVTGELQAKPGLAPTSGYPGWTLLRRNIPYTVSVTGCSLDDPADGTGVHDETFCAGSGSAGSDPNPIDYRRFTVRVGWQRKDGPRSFSQTTLVAPRGQSEAPSITSLTSTGGITITDSSLTSVNFTATTSAVPAGVAWSMNAGVRGLATGGGKSWSFTWNIAGLPDGQYDIGAKAYNTVGTYGTPASLTITLNRSPPSAPGGFAAGWNRTASKVDTEWLASTDLDTVGYRVYRQQTAPTTGSVTQVNCGTVASPVYITTQTTCTDVSPIIAPSGGGDGTISFRAASSNLVPAQANLTIAKPSGVVAGDFLVATISSSRAAASTPTGWTLIISTPHSPIQQVSFYRVAGTSEPSGYTFSTSDGSKQTMIGGIVAYAGVDQNAPIDGSIGADGAGGNANGPSLTTRYAGDRVINAVTFNETGNGGNTTLPDPSLTERYDSESAPVNAEYADGTQATAGPTGPKVASPSGSTNGFISQVIALKPGAATGVNGISVNYWVKALDRDALGNYREGPASNVVDAYAPDLAPTPITGLLTCTSNADGSATLGWTQPSQPGDPDSGDYIAFDRIYRDGSRYDTTGLNTDNTYTAPTPGGTHTYYVTTVDTHLMESTPSGSVTC